MKRLKIFLLILLALTLTQNVFSQRKLGGKAVEVIDGKTFVIETPDRGRITIVLQFIEIPDPEQPLYQTVKEHLEKLVLDKTIEFLPKGLTRQTTIAQAFLNNTDISLQMLRDGAAWYSLPEMKSQDAQEREIYLLTEGQAKIEKRGVWSIENLKPAWEFRAEKEEIKKQQERAKIDEVKPQTEQVAQTNQITRRPTQTRQGGYGLGLDMWSNVNNSASSKQSPINGGLLTGTSPNYGISYVMTSGNFVNLTSGTTRQKMESRSIYLYKTTETNSVYIIGFLSQSEKYSFADSNSLTITADGKKFSLGKAYRFYREIPSAVQELLLYQIDAAALSKIAQAKNLQMTLGKFSGSIGNDYQELIKNLLTVTK